MAQQVLQRERFGAVAHGLRRHSHDRPSLSIDALQIQQAAAAAAGAQQYPAPALYLLATPIGNLADITLRAVHVLGLVDAVACEDSRVTGSLLHHLGLHKPLLALHQHNEREAAAAVLQRLRAGQRVAYASDAGTPAVSDPGAALVQAVAAEGSACVPIPGASSVVTALSVAGDAASTGFHFCGFAPPKGQERQRALDAACDDGAPRCGSRRRIASARWPMPGLCVPARGASLYAANSPSSSRPWSRCQPASFPPGSPPTRNARAVSLCWCCTPRRVATARLRTTPPATMCSTSCWPSCR